MAFWKRKEFDAADEDTARRLVEAAKSVLAARERLVPASAADFPGVDHAFYDSTASELGQSAAQVGDYHNADQPAGDPAKRSFYRLALTADRTTLINIFTTAQRADGKVARVLSLSSHLADGRVIYTTRGGASGSYFEEPPEHLSEKCPAEATTDAVLQRHAARVAESGSPARRFASLEEAVATRQGTMDDVAAWRRGVGVRFFETAIRRTAERFPDRLPALLAALKAHPEWLDTASMKEPVGAKESGMQETSPRRLPLPAEVTGARQAQEVAGIWMCDGHQTFLIDVGPFEDPAVWGMTALYLMKHVARAYEQRTGMSREDAYKRILMGFSAEMQNPTEPL